MELRALIFALAVCVAASAASADSRIKDIADFEGVRDNLLVGYGLVVGLNGTGDDLKNSGFTKQSLIGMLERLGVNTRDDVLKTENVAAVMVTATLPPFARQGVRIDVSVAALGDAKSLLGGTLLVTPMIGADGEVYAVAQGPLAIGGFSAKGAATSVTKGVPTSGRISNGAIVEREIDFRMANLRNVRVSLRNPDLTTARRIANAINRLIGSPAATAVDSATVALQVPETYQGGVVALLTDIEQLRVAPDQVARVVIDETSGVIVMGENVRISTVAIAQGNLTVRITETPQVSQPTPFSPGPGVLPSIPGTPGTGAAIGAVPRQRLTQNGQPVFNPDGSPVFDMVPQAVQGTGTPTAPPVPGAIGGGASTVVVPRTDIQVDEDKGRRLMVVPAGISLQELVNGLNALGVGPRDMITILQSIKAAGALQAEIQVM
jgi:flagellar P-ring protein precursor FlgI